MRLLSVLGALILAGSLVGQNEGKPIKDAWDVIYLGGARAGYARTTITEIQRDGKPLYHTTLETNLRFKRYMEIVAMGLTQRSEETAEGKVRTLSLTTKLDRGQLVQDGRVEGNVILVRVGEEKTPRKLPWNDEVIGLAAQDRLWAGRKLEPGLVVRYRNYDPSLANSVALTAKVREREDAVILEDRGTPEQPKGEQVRRPLWRIVVEAEPVTLPTGQRINLPDQVLWVDDAGRTLRSESELPGLGRMTMLRTTKGLALANDAAPAEMPDLGLNTLVKLAKPIPRGHEANKIVYRIAVKGDPMPHRAFASDARQKAGEPKVDLFELTVQAVREPVAVSGLPAPTDPENLRSTQLLDSDNERIKETASKVTAGESDPWVKARKLERWVRENMKPTAAIGLVKASQVCVDLKGDCRQHGMLLAALCRAAGIPARTAQGLVYVDDPRHGPILGFHLWTEVWVKGQWMSLDATLGKGSVGAGHLKISDSSWKDGEGLAPLLSLIQVLGRLQVEVVSVE